ncbi:MAG: cupin domain-containing protein [Bacillota bacterium]|nr:cupin domain-containing protein [Bacillota bacterium]
MADAIREIAIRITALRDICGISVETMAQKLEMSCDKYLEYEKGKKDFAISFLCKVADIFGVDVLDLMSGESPTLSVCCVVKNGEGYDVKRNRRYDYKHLAFTFRNKKAEPFMVTVAPDDKPPVMNTHEGQEFDYVVSGKMLFYIGDISYELNKGDSVYFDSSLPHAEKAIGTGPTKFIAVVIK